MSTMSMTFREAKVEFSAAMLKSLVGKPWGVVSAFDCPLCGSAAKAYSSPENGRKIAICTECRFRVTELQKR